MKQVKAFLAALLLFAVTAAGGHIYIRDRVSVNNPEFSVWTEEEKSKSFVGLTENMNEESFPVFGSSEFQHGTETAYHPANLFSQSRFNPMLIGAGYYQSLSHTIALAALENSMEQRKAVLILSPQWFRKTGVVAEAYASRFSETLYVGMLENEKLSDETKEYISKRTHELLGRADERTLERVALHEKVLWKQEGNGLEMLQEKLWNRFLQEKDMFSVSMLQSAAGIKKGAGLPDTETEPDWDTLLEQAEADGRKENQNEFFIDDRSYQLLEPHLSRKKDINKDVKKGYQTSPEYDDLRCFLQVCRELGITPMLVLMPVNGYYYDYTGFSEAARSGYYENICALAEEYGVQVADFSDQEYTKYFFEDRVHIGKKGWVMICERLYRFYQED